jgi:hypothetical protein
VSHAGLALLRELAERSGLTAGLSGRCRRRQGGHDRGRVFATTFTSRGVAGISGGAAGRESAPTLLASSNG